MKFVVFVLLVLLLLLFLCLLLLSLLLNIFLRLQIDTPYVQTLSSAKLRE